ncbi:MAG TPA: hypothetical protein VK961_23270, partial [Chthoniobacter sp.]|nr:hypothetical protein [Chthoniobacter sp.]
MNLIRSEKITVRDGRSLLDVRGSNFDAVLLIDGRPLLYHWSDCMGSVAQYLVYSMTPDAAQTVLSFRASFGSAAIGDASLALYLAPVLPALAPSEYALNYYEAPQAYDIVEFDNRWDVTKDAVGYYPGCASFVTTQPTSSLSGERISFYEQRIQKGERPILLTVSVEEGWSDFVIDGHHKLAAYTRTHTPPHYLSIQR